MLLEYYYNTQSAGNIPGETWEELRTETRNHILKSQLKKQMDERVDDSHLFL